MTDWQPRFLTPGEEPALLELLTATFGTWPKVELSCPPLDHLRWKLEGGIRGESYLTAVVQNGGRMVGAVVMLSRPTRILGSPALATSGADVAVHPSYQQRGILSAIARFTLHHFAEVYDLSFAYFGRNPAVARVAEQADRGLFGNTPDILVANRTDASSLAEPVCSVRVAPRFDARADALSREATGVFDFYGERGHEYLNWRYADERAGAFTMFVAEDGGALLGYVVARTSHGAGFIADVLAMPGREDVVGPLIDAAACHLREAGVSTLQCCCPARHPYRNAIMAAGFNGTRTVQRFMYASYHHPHGLDVLRAPHTRVHLTLGDTDLV